MGAVPCGIVTDRGAEPEQPVSDGALGGAKRLSVRTVAHDARLGVGRELERRRGYGPPFALANESINVSAAHRTVEGGTAGAQDIEWGVNGISH
jgi:hypothetical protein